MLAKGLLSPRAQDAVLRSSDEAPRALTVGQAITPQLSARAAEGVQAPARALREKGLK